MDALQYSASHEIHASGIGPLIILQNSFLEPLSLTSGIIETNPAFIKNIQVRSFGYEAVFSNP